MSTLYTQCPGCNTTFRINAKKLKAARGEVMCQNCHIIFNALNSLSSTVKEAVNESESPEHPPLLGNKEAVFTSRYEKEVFHEKLDDPMPSLTPPPRNIRPGNRPGWADREEDDDHPQAYSTRTGSLAWGIGTFILLGLWLFQVGIFEGNRLLQNEQMRPWLEFACENFHCKLPPYRDPRQIQIVDRALLPAPGDVEGYEFTLIVSNQSSLAQAFPDLKLVLTALDNQPVASRIFKPEEYLDEERPRSMPVGKPFEVRLLLAKPSREVGGFSFELMQTPTR